MKKKTRRRAEGFGFGGEGLECGVGVHGLGFRGRVSVAGVADGRASTLWLGVWGLGFGMWGLGFGVWG